MPSSFYFNIVDVKRTISLFIRKKITFLRNRVFQRVDNSKRSFVSQGSFHEIVILRAGQIHESRGVEGINHNDVSNGTVPIDSVPKALRAGTVGTRSKIAR
jgi:hypothetical protein